MDEITKQFQELRQVMTTSEAVEILIKGRDDWLTILNKLLPVINLNS